MNRTDKIAQAIIAWGSEDNEVDLTDREVVWDLAQAIDAALRTKPIRVFVYGTLKSGYGNHERLLKSSRFVGKAKTRGGFRMSDVGFPFVVRAGIVAEDARAGFVTGEVYEVDHETLGRLDMLEGNGRMYQREVVPLRMANGQMNWAYMYIKIGELAGRPVKPRNGVLEWNLETKRMFA